LSTAQQRGEKKARRGFKNPRVAQHIQTYLDDETLTKWWSDIIMSETLMNLIGDNCGFIDSAALAAALSTLAVRQQQPPAENSKVRRVLKDSHPISMAFQKFKNAPGQVLLVPFFTSIPQHWSMLVLLHTHNLNFFAVHYDSYATPNGLHLGRAGPTLEQLFMESFIPWTKFSEIRLQDPPQNDDNSCGMFSIRFAQVIFAHRDRLLSLQTGEDIKKYWAEIKHEMPNDATKHEVKKSILSDLLRRVS
jgi:hypothetical protein